MFSEFRKKVPNFFHVKLIISLIKPEAYFLNLEETKMKKRILLAITTMFILMLGIVAFAVNQSNNSSKTAADSCAMKAMNAQSADGQTKTSCCDRDDCCCKNGSCPMKKEGAVASESCCSNCCGDACPMKNEQAQAMSVDEKDVTASSGDNCKNKHS